jgi:hypothetical protein
MKWQPQETGEVNYASHPKYRFKRYKPWSNSGTAIMDPQLHLAKIEQKKPLRILILRY